MADNVTYQATTLATPPSGTVVSTDDVQIGGTQPTGAVQWVKLADGTPNGTAYVPATTANGLLTDVSRVQGVVHVDDNAGSLTIDAPVGTPANVRLSDGAANYDATKTGQLPAALVGGRLDENVGAWLGSTVPTVGQKAMASSLPVALASDQSVLPAVAEQRAATLHVTGTAAVNTGVTVTLGAAGAGLFHYITSLEVIKLYAVVGVAAAAGVIITSTNLPGNPAWTTEQLASVAGTVVRVLDYHASAPLKSSVANTATTIVCPVQLQTIWRVNVSYFTAA